MAICQRVNESDSARYGAAEVDARHSPSRFTLWVANEPGKLLIAFRRVNKSLTTQQIGLWRPEIGSRVRNLRVSLRSKLRPVP